MQIFFPIPLMLEHDVKWAVPYTSTGWVENGLRAAQRGNTFWVAVGEQLSVTQCALAAQRTQLPFWAAPGQQAKGGDSPPLLW